MNVGFIGPGLMVAVFGVSVIAWTKRNASKGSESLGWPKVPGRVTASEVAVTTDQEGDKSFSAAIKYAYEVSGKILQGRRIAFAPAPHTAQRCQELVAAYPVGLDVSVSYNPSKPKKAVLVPGMQQAPQNMLVQYGIVAFGVILIVIGLVWPG